ncbi:MAG: thioredoxin family protein [Chloroflexota bacterium]|nr:MAG: thioredoxin family protein [Chloroflexota bacterium]
MPVMSADRFQKATTFAQYVDQMKVNKETMQKFTDEVQISDEDAAWWKAQGKLNVFVLTYDGCGDALYNLPIFAKIARLCPNIDLRVVQRDENLDIMDQYRNQGLYRSVPTFIFMDTKMNEIGNLKERAESITAIFEAEQLKVRRALRVQYQAEWRTEMAREFRNVVATKKRYP